MLAGWIPYLHYYRWWWWGLLAAGTALSLHRGRIITGNASVAVQCSAVLADELCARARSTIPPTCECAQGPAGWSVGRGLRSQLCGRSIRAMAGVRTYVHLTAAPHEKRKRASRAALLQAQVRSLRKTGPPRSTHTHTSALPLDPSPPRLA